MRLCIPTGTPAPPGFINRNMPADQGVYTLTGKAAGLNYTPVAAVSWPTSTADARFATNVDGGYNLTNDGAPIITWANLDFTRTDLEGTANQPVRYNNYVARNCRFIDIPEGPRLGENVTIDGCWIRIVGRDGAHGDGLQAQAAAFPQQTMTNIWIRNTYIETTPGGFNGGYSNCGIFCADKAGVSIKLENVYIDGTGASHGAIWLPNRAGDIGVYSVDYNNVVLKNCIHQPAGLDYSAGLQPTIVQWTNVRDDSGTIIPRPY